ncbi:hypothetical protein ACTXT7_015897 [Hymenolepis weldensis]
MTSLSVRYPTGHLNNIPVVPTEPLIKVLEAACAKKSLDPKLHKLVHNRRTLDLSVPFRFSGLANRATLELVPCDQTTVTNSKVQIGVRLQDGYRTEWNGMSNSTIWSVLESLASEDQRIAGMLVTSDDLVPTVMYLQNYFGGEEILRDTTLNSLAIRDSALFQLMKRPAPPPITKKESKTYSVSPTSDAPKPTESKAESEQSTPPRRKSSREPSSEASVETSVEEARLLQPSQGAFQQQQNLSQGESALSFEPFSIFGNTPKRSMFGTDNEPKAHNQRKRSMTIGEMLGISLEPDSRTSSSEAAVSPQLREFKNWGDFIAAQSNKAFVETWLRDFPEEFTELALHMSLALRDRNLDIFIMFNTSKSTKGSFPCETEGQNLMDPEDGSEENETARARPCDREEKIFGKEMDTTTATTSQDDTDELPDQYFELSRAELQRILADLRKVAGKDVLLGEQTAQKRAAQSKVLRFFPRCVVRFIWSDNIVLQAFSALYDFVRERLADQGLSFYLFTAPPRVVLSNMTETLFKSKLHPSAKIYFSVKSGPSKGREVLKSDLLDRITPESETEARGIATKWMPNSTTQRKTPK